MAGKTPGGLPDYFELFQSLINPAMAKGADSMKALLDPEALEKKINELEIVIAWLKATTTVLETSVEAMIMQKKLLEGLRRPGVERPKRGRR
ncbi:MAG: hypothetical protein JNK75_03475 [Betaproteobacteria bacterium]|nr:hypothetical protein [Betaproteobacteria bacterium]